VRGSRPAQMRGFVRRRFRFRRRLSSFIFLRGACAGWGTSGPQQAEKTWGMDVQKRIAFFPPFLYHRRRRDAGAGADGRPSPQLMRTMPLGGEVKGRAESTTCPATHASPARFWPGGGGGAFFFFFFFFLRPVFLTFAPFLSFFSFFAVILYPIYSL